MSKNLTSIGRRSFLNCISLKEITIPDKVEYIGEGAFQDCVALKEITIPEKVEQMGYGVFKGCTSLETINVSFNKGKQPQGWDSGWSYGCNAKIVYANGETEQLNSES